MRKAITISGMIIIFLLSTGLASAGFTDIKMEKNVSVVAGNSDYSKISFFFSGDNQEAPLILRVNITSPETEVWKGDFKLDAYLKAGAGDEKISMQCIENPEEIQNGEFLTNFYKHQFPTEIPNGTFYCYNKDQFFILEPNAEHELRVNFHPNIALKPAEFGVEYDFMSVLGFPVFEPILSTDEKGILEVPEIGLEIDSNATGKVNFTITTYSRIYIKPSIPSGEEKAMKYVEIKPQEKGLNGTIRIDYNRTKLIGQGLEKPEIYRCELTATGCNWVKNFERGRTSDYVWVKVEHFSLYGVFASEKPKVVTETVYRGGGGGTEYVTRYRNVTQNQTVTEEAECGNDICEADETCSSCPSDCGCPDGYSCEEGVCVSVPECGNGVCEEGETVQSCSVDCKEEEKCVPDWKCEQWSKCISGTQTRKCVDSNKCGKGELSTRTEERDCTVTAGAKGATTGPTGFFARNQRSTVAGIIALIIVGTLLYWKLGR